MLFRSNDSDTTYLASAYRQVGLGFLGILMALLKAYFEIRCQRDESVDRKRDCLAGAAMSIPQRMVRMGVPQIYSRPPNVRRWPPADRPDRRHIPS